MTFDTRTKLSEVSFANACPKTAVGSRISLKSEVWGVVMNEVTGTKIFGAEKVFSYLF